MLRPVLTAAICVSLLCGISPADEDAVEKKLAAAKGEYEKATGKAQAGLIDTLKKKADAAQKAGDLNALEKIEAEAKAFKDTGDLPKSVPTKAYESELRRARAKLEDAYAAAVREYTKAGQRTLAKVTQQELDNFKKGRPSDEGAKWTALFNGKDLTGWKTHRSQPGNWQVKNGVLIGSGPSAVGHLYSIRGDYTDFHLRLEARIHGGKGVHSTGVYFRAPFGPNLPMDKPTWVTGYCAKIDERRLGGLLIDMDRELHRTRESVLQPGEWLTYEVIAEDNHIVIKVNGQTTSDYTDDKRRYMKGHIVLQKHGAETVAEFRKVEIKSIPPKK